MPVGWNTETEMVRPIEGDGHGGGEEQMADDIVACMFNGKPMPTRMKNGGRFAFRIHLLRNRGGKTEWKSH